MDLKSAFSRAGDTFGSIKDRVGSMAGRDDRYNYDDFDEFDDYDAYREDYVDPIYEDKERYLPLESFDSYHNSSSPKGDYDRNDAYRTSYASGRTQVSSLGTGSSLNRSTVASYTSPALVTSDDVKEHVRIPASLERDPLPERKVTRPARVGAAYNATASAAVSSASSSAYESSFAAPSSAAGSYQNANSVYGASRGAGASTSTAPRTTYSANGTPIYSPTRSLEIMRPLKYEDGQRIVKLLRAGDAVVLITQDLSEDLSKRILDFAFGAACALEASVDCIAPQSYVFTRSHDLTKEEMEKLRSMGIRA